MIIVTLQVTGNLKPELSVHGDIVKIDLGALLFEMDTETFKTMMADLVTQAANHGVYDQQPI